MTPESSSLQTKWTNENWREPRRFSDGQRQVIESFQLQMPAGPGAKHLFKAAWSMLDDAMGGSG